MDDLADGATPGTDNETPSGQPEPNNQDNEPGTPPDGATPEAAGEADPEGEQQPEEDNPLHKALKAERQSVKDLKAANATLSSTNAELLAKLEEMEAAELERKTAQLVESRKLTKEQAEALRSLPTLEDRESFAAVMYPPPPPGHRSVAGLGYKPTWEESLFAEADRRGIVKEAQRQIWSEINDDYWRRHEFEDMDNDRKAAFFLRKAQHRSATLTGKKPDPVY